MFKRERKSVGAAELGYTSRPLKESVTDYLSWRRHHRPGKKDKVELVSRHSYWQELARKKR